MYKYTGKFIVGSEKYNLIEGFQMQSTKHENKLILLSEIYGESF